MRERRGRRPLVIAGGWLVAVALAVLVGVVGINLVGSGLTGEQAAPMTEDEVARELRSLASAAPSPPASAAPSAATPSAVTPSIAAAGTSFTTPGGLVVADCGRILSMAPAQGWAVAEKDGDEGEFRSSDDPPVVLEVDLECVAGQPRILVTPGD
ncbi:hypothetical protein AB0F72_32135 [Actinoplanes sp. NPDC023936]|uniref:hypothetical protein n=1 Tax=Actinoplanes sp. NPDC023936 TaxID=3154910 RepID=UPI0033E1F0B7